MALQVLGYHSVSGSFVALLVNFGDRECMDPFSVFVDLAPPRAYHSSTP
jgi:hypothetical protein